MLRRDGLRPVAEFFRALLLWLVVLLQWFIISYDASPCRQDRPLAVTYGAGERKRGSTVGFCSKYPPLLARTTAETCGSGSDAYQSVSQLSGGVARIRKCCMGFVLLLREMFACCSVYAEIAAKVGGWQELVIQQQMQQCHPR